MLSESLRLTVSKDHALLADYWEVVLVNSRRIVALESKVAVALSVIYHCQT